MNITDELVMLRGFLTELKNEHCWCSVGIGGPRIGGKHSDVCKAIKIYFEQRPKGTWA